MSRFPGRKKEKGDNIPSLPPRSHGFVAKGVKPPHNCSHPLPTSPDAPFRFGRKKPKTKALSQILPHFFFEFVRVLRGLTEAASRFPFSDPGAIKTGGGGERRKEGGKKVFS